MPKNRAQQGATTRDKARCNRLKPTTQHKITRHCGTTHGPAARHTTYQHNRTVQHTHSKLQDNTHAGAPHRQRDPGTARHKVGGNSTPNNNPRQHAKTSASREDTAQQHAVQHREPKHLTSTAPDQVPQHLTERHSARGTAKTQRNSAANMIAHNPKQVRTAQHSSTQQSAPQHGER